MARRSKPTVLDVNDAIIRRAAERWTDDNFHQPPGAIGQFHEEPIVEAFLMGARFELRRQAGRLVSDALVFRLGPEARRWFRSVLNAIGVNTCDPDSWRNVLINSFDRGATEARKHLAKITKPKGRR